MSDTTLEVSSSYNYPPHDNGHVTQCTGDPKC